MPTPSGSTPYSAASFTGNALINSLLYGTKWTGNALTFSFPNYSSYFLSGYAENNNYFTPLVAQEQAAVRNALLSWGAVANINLTETTETSSNVGDLRFAYSWTSSVSNSQAWAYGPGSTQSAIDGDVWFNRLGSSYGASWVPGSSYYETAIHEIGHALGLKHPFSVSQYNTQLISGFYDSRSYTVMSYSAVPGNNTTPGDITTKFSYEPTSPMILDIIAIQSLYGANTTYNATNTVYAVYGGQSYHMTIWDAGGSDTINYISATGGFINLVPGLSGGSYLGNPVYSQTSAGVNIARVANIWIADGVIIENANGGSGGDLILGNAGTNRLDGLEGNDSLNGGVGNDTLTGGIGLDQFDVTSGVDSITDLGNGGTDVLVVSSGATANAAVTQAWTASSVTSNAGVANLTSAGLAVNLSAVTTGLGFNVLNTGVATTLSGSSLADSLTGATGNDTLIGNAGNDTLSGAEGSDNLTGGQGNDSLVLTESTAASDVVVFSGGTGTAGTLIRVGTLGLDTISGMNLGTSTTAIDRLLFSAADFGVSAGTVVIKGGGNVDGNFYVVSGAPTATAVDINGAATGIGSAIVCVGTGSSTSVGVYFTTNEGAFSTATAVQIATLVGVNTTTLDASDLSFVV